MKQWLARYDIEVILQMEDVRSSMMAAAFRDGTPQYPGKSAAVVMTVLHDGKLVVWLLKFRRSHELALWSTLFPHKSQSRPRWQALKQEFKMEDNRKVLSQKKQLSLSPALHHRDLAPDPAIFDSIDFDPKHLERFQMISFLERWSKIVFRDGRRTSPVEAEFQYGWDQRLRATFE